MKKSNVATAAIILAFLFAFWVAVDSVIQLYGAQSWETYLVVVAMSIFFILLMTNDGVWGWVENLGDDKDD